jgi:hypothetical protein
MQGTSGEHFQEAAQQCGPGFLVELFHFLRCNKKWWLFPFLVVLLLFGLLVFLSGSAAAPFIYTLF